MSAPRKSPTSIGRASPAQPSSLRGLLPPVFSSIIHGPDPSGRLLPLKLHALALDL